MHYRERRWRLVQQQVSHVAVGPGGGVWALGAAGPGAPGERPVLRLEGERLEPVGSSAVSLAVGLDDLPWTLGADQRIRRMTADHRLEELPGQAAELAAGASGAVWAIGPAGTGNRDGGAVLRWDGEAWTRTSGAGIGIAVAPDGLPWIVNRHRVLYRLTGYGAWVRVAGRARGVSIGADGSVWTIRTPEVEPGGIPVFRGRLRNRPRPRGAAPEWAATYVEHNVPRRLPAGDLRAFWVTLENCGSNLWTRERCALAVAFDGVRLLTVELPHAVDRGESVSVSWILRVPERIGRHRIQIELIEKGAAPLSAHGVTPLDLQLDVVAAPTTPTRQLRDLVLETQSRCWLPCDGVSWSRNGSGFPIFAREAHGCRITDIEGRVYVDYLMGWGTAVLGYAHHRIQGAIVQALGCGGATLSLTHTLMLEVAEKLRARFPGAESVTFGKNGSDACTAAVRLARAFTGRPMILVCGYHGWQDWYVEKYGFAATSVPNRDKPLVVQFEMNSLEHVSELLETHGEQVAAVMLEPAAPMTGDNEPIREADPDFLRELIAIAHRRGALVIFDEIMTGFRYPGGSVQQATGIVPDLTCLGKALAAGMPLSAVVGRADIFRGVGKIFFEPTYKGEIYAFAAAREALTLYDQEDVPGRIQLFGERLRRVIHRAGGAQSVPVRVEGPPFRMMVGFDEVDDRRRTLMRTLLNQELLAHGVLTTQNLLIPSTAHDEEALAHTERAFEHALDAVSRAMADDSFASRLEIPPLP